MPHAQVFTELSMNFHNLSHRQCKVMKDVFIRADVCSLIYGDMSLECLNHQPANRFIPRSMADNNMLKTLAVVWKEDYWCLVMASGWMKKNIFKKKRQKHSLFTGPSLIGFKSIYLGVTSYVSSGKLQTLFKVASNTSYWLSDPSLIIGNAFQWLTH